MSDVAESTLLLLPELSGNTAEMAALQAVLEKPLARDDATRGAVS
jgi:hypothetical protein